MSILSPTKMKVSNIIDRKEIVSNLQTTQSVTVPVEFGKDLHIIITNSGGVGLATLSILSTNVAKTSGNWFSQNVISDKEFTITNNAIQLPTGITIFKISSSKLIDSDTITLNFVGATNAIVYGYISWVGNYDEKVKIADYKSITKGIINKAFEKKLEKNIRITIIPSSIDANNLLDVSFTTNGAWANDKIVSSVPVKNVGSNKLRITEQTTFIVNNIYLYSSTLFTITSTGNATGVFYVESSDIPYDKKGYYSKLLTTTTSIGDAYYFKPDLDAKYIIACVDAVIQSDSVTIGFKPINNKLQIVNEFIEVGDSSNKGNIITITSTSKKYYIIKNTNDLYQINTYATIIGDSNNVEVSFANLNTENELESFLENQKPYYEDKNIIIENQGIYTKFASYENWTASLGSDGILTVSNGETKASTNLTSLPNWKIDDTINTIGFIPFKKGGKDLSGYSRETSMRLCFFTNKGNIYHNYPAGDAEDKTSSGGMVDFDLSIIYEPIYKVLNNEIISSERIPTKTVDADDKIYRYEPGLPDWNYEQHTNNIGGFKADGTAYGSGGLPPINEKNGVKVIKMIKPFETGTNPQNNSYPFKMSGYLNNAFSIKPKCTIYVPYNGINATKHVILGTTDGGRIWVVLNEMGSNGFVTKYGNNLDYSSIGTYTSAELSLVKRTFVIPNATTKEPQNCFSYGIPITITNITTTNGKAIVTTSSAHGLVDGDYICFKKNTDGNYSFLNNTVNSNNTSGIQNNSAGNGRFYSCKVLTSTTFELLQNYAGVDEKIPVHHIHSSNPIKDGVTISCGERYPNGWILLIPIPEIDDFESFDIYNYRVNNRYVLRLTSSENSVQRPVGFILNDDVEQTYLYASDEKGIFRYFNIEGRTKNFLKRNSAGLFRGKLAGIDDFSTTECILEMDEACLGVINSQGLYVVLGMSRCTYVSTDLNNWIKIPIISSYVGEGIGCTYIKSVNTIYKVSKK